MTTPTFTNESSRKAYQKGCAEIARKLSRVPKKEAEADRRARIIAEGKAHIAKRFGAEFFRKSFGMDPPAPAKTTKAPAPAPAPARKVLAANTTTGPRKLHRYVCRNWLPSAV